MFRGFICSLIFKLSTFSIKTQHSSVKRNLYSKVDEEKYSFLNTMVQNLLAEKWHGLSGRKCIPLLIFDKGSRCVYRFRRQRKLNQQQDTFFLFFKYKDISGYLLFHLNLGYAHLRCALSLSNNKCLHFLVLNNI